MDLMDVLEFLAGFLIFPIIAGFASPLLSKLASAVLVPLLAKLPFISGLLLGSWQGISIFWLLTWALISLFLLWLAYFIRTSVGHGYLTSLIVQALLIIFNGVLLLPNMLLGLGK